jgi:hypothetical protein
MADLDTLDGFEGEMGSLETVLADTQVMAAAFSGEMQKMKSAMSDAGQQVGNVSTGLSRGLRRAFDGLIFDGMKLSDALGQIGRSMLQASYSAAVTPITRQLGQSLGNGLEAAISGILPFAKGGSFMQGRVQPFAKGGVVTAPTSFPMRGATGLMGEAGPEAIMPLSRAPDGSLGVRMQGMQQPVSVVVNISTPDATSFRRSESQIAAQMSRALSRGGRNR